MCKRNRNNENYTSHRYNPSNRGCAVSLDAMRWAFALDGPRLGDRLVLLVLADHADQAHSCYPSMRRVAERAGLSIDSARACLRRLEAAGLVHTEMRPVEGGRNQSNRYYLNVTDAEVDGWNPFAEGAPLQTGGTPLANRGQVPPSKPGAGAPQQTGGLNSQYEPSTGTVNEPTPSGFDAFWAIYPRKDDKPASKRAWEKAITRATPEKIILEAKAYAQDPNRVPRFTKMPATWLNGDGWENDALPERIVAERKLSNAEHGVLLYQQIAADEAAQNQKGITA
jgi:hypothetical protein